jgi:uncharacterized protein YegP (UPF0339 family)
MTTSPWFRVYEDAAGDWRWTYYAANGLKIADSAEGYRNKRDCLHGLWLVKQYAGNAKIEDYQETTHHDELVQALLRRRRRASLLGG